MAGSDASEGQAVWQPGGAKDSRLREGNRHLHLAYDEEEEWRRAEIDTQEESELCTIKRASLCILHDTNRQTNFNLLS